MKGRPLKYKTEKEKLEARKKIKSKYNRSEKGQITLLRYLAKKYGYRLVKI